MLCVVIEQSSGWYFCLNQLYIFIKQSLYKFGFSFVRILNFFKNLNKKKQLQNARKAILNTATCY